MPNICQETAKESQGLGEGEERSPEEDFLQPCAPAAIDSCGKTAFKRAPCMNVPEQLGKGGQELCKAA